MRQLWGAALFALAIGTVPAEASDLSKIERAIGREPAYQAQPKYCLLVFGPEADTRVWLVLDGATLHVSNNMGELTGDGSRAVAVLPTGSCSAGSVTEVDGTSACSDLRVMRQDDAVRLLISSSDRKKRQGAGFDPENKLCFSESPDKAPIVHFGGPMEIGLSGAKPALRRGETTKIRLGIGTAGVGRGSFAAYQGCAAPDGAITAALEVPRASALGEKRLARSDIENEN